MRFLIRLVNIDFDYGDPPKNRLRESSFGDSVRPQLRTHLITVSQLIVYLESLYGRKR